jgi:flagellum-specific ATP synthase
MQDIIPPDHLDLARRFRHMLSTYQQHRDLINIGAYQRGSDPRVDAAIAMWPKMQKFLQQGIKERVGHAESVRALAQMFAEADAQGLGGAT